MFYEVIVYLIVDFIWLYLEWTRFSHFFAGPDLYLALAICIALPYKVQRWTRVGRDSNPCMIFLIPSATPGLSVVIFGWCMRACVCNCEHISCKLLMWIAPDLQLSCIWEQEVNQSHGETKYGKKYHLFKNVTFWQRHTGQQPAVEDQKTI